PVIVDRDRPHARKEFLERLDPFEGTVAENVHLIAALPDDAAFHPVEPAGEGRRDHDRAGVIDVGRQVTRFRRGVTEVGEGKERLGSNSHSAKRGGDADDGTDGRSHGGKLVSTPTTGDVVQARRGSGATDIRKLLTLIYRGETMAILTSENGLCGANFPSQNPCLRLQNRPPQRP